MACANLPMGKDFQIVVQRKGRAMGHVPWEKPSRFIPEWAAHQESQGEPKRYTLSLAREEIAQMIGATRETVTRFFADFKMKQLHHTKSSTFLIKDHPGLQRIVAGH